MVRDFIDPTRTVTSSLLLPQPLPRPFRMSVRVGVEFECARETHESHWVAAVRSWSAEVSGALFATAATCTRLDEEWQC